MRAPGLALVILGPLLGCGSQAEPTGQSPATTDSAGVLIRRSDRPVWSRRETPVVDAAPVFSVGMETDQIQFRGISSALRTSDGKIVVLDRGPLEIFVLGETGEFLARLGGKGDGPGEFRELWKVHLVGDTIVAFDPRARRITWFALDGELLDMLSVEGDEHPLWRYQLAGPLGSGWLLTGLIYLPGACADLGPCWDTLPTLRIGSDGGVEVPDGFEAAGVTAFGNAGYPFSARTWSHATPTGVLFADGRRPEIRRYSASGDLRLIGRWAGTQRPAERSDLAAYLSAKVAEVRERGFPTEQVEHRFDGLQLMPHMPAFRGMLVDRVGRTWLEPYAPDHESAPTDWTVLESDGTWLGTVRMPENTAVLDIGIDYVLGAWTDELDVQYLRLYVMRQPPDA